MKPIEKAIAAVGSQSKLAKALGESAQFIYRMKKGDGRISTQKVSPDKWAAVAGLSKKELFPEFQD